MNYSLAEKSDLVALKELSDKVVDKMYEQNIKMWSKTYPFCEFESDIEKRRVFVLKNEDNKIVACCTIYAAINEDSMFDWQDKTNSAIYLKRLIVNADFMRKNMATKIFKAIKNFAINHNIQNIRLSVADINIPAISLYKKLGFVAQKTQYKDYVKERDLTLNLIGFEYKIK